MSANNNQPGALTRFFWFCSGADPEILSACPRAEHIKYGGIGGTVFCTGVLAALSGGYAFYTAFDSVFAAVFFGLLWGLVIFNLDRFIVSTIKKEGGFRRQFTLAIPRLLLAIVLAIVISKPLELRVFQEEIVEILTEQRVAKGAAAGAAFGLKSEELEAGIVALREATATRFLQREADYQDYKCECDGTCGTGQTGRGSECVRKEAKYLQSNQEYQLAKAENDAETDRLRVEITGLTAEAVAARQLADDSFSDGLLARLSASNELPVVPGLFLILLFALIEISPILAKILAPRGPYDDILHRVERQFALQQLRLLEEDRLRTDKEAALRDGLRDAAVNATVHQKQQALRAVSDARQELVQDQVDAWIEEEKERMERERNSR